MDVQQFDQLARSLTEAGSRRGLLGLLASLPVVGGLLGILDADDAEAKGRRRRRKKRHKHGKGRRRRRNHKRKHPCTPTSPAEACAALGATCGSIPDGCGGTLTCGACTGVCRNNTCSLCSASNPCPTGQCCATDGSCAACLVFVTSTTSTGALGGLAGGDQRCQELATAAGLPGDYLAWLSDTTGSPSTRFVRATVPYTLVNGTVIARDWDDLTDGSLAAPLSVTETGSAVPNPGVWTGTTTSGTAVAFQGPAGDNCANWSMDAVTTYAAFGRNDETNPEWTNHPTTYPACSIELSLYCFQQS